MNFKVIQLKMLIMILKFIFTSHPIDTIDTKATPFLYRREMRRQNMKARELALKVLLDIEENGNYSNIAINKHFKNINLNNQDRGLATELIYGVVENKYYLDYIIDKLSKIKCKKMDIYVKILLRMGIYQILLLTIYIFIIKLNIHFPYFIF